MENMIDVHFWKMEQKAIRQMAATTPKEYGEMLNRKRRKKKRR